MEERERKGGAGWWGSGQAAHTPNAPGVPVPAPTKETTADISAIAGHQDLVLNFGGGLLDFVFGVSPEGVFCNALLNAVIPGWLLTPGKVKMFQITFKEQTSSLSHALKWGRRDKRRRRYLGVPSLPCSCLVNCLPKRTL